MIRGAGAKKLSSAFLLLVGLLALSLCGVRLYQRQLRLHPSGKTAGGAASPIDMCQRGVPPDVAAACIAQQEAEDRAAQLVILNWGLIGLGSLVTAAALAWRRSKQGAARGGAT